MKKIIAIILGILLLPIFVESIAQTVPPREKFFHSNEVPTHDLWNGAVRLRAFQGNNTMLVLNEIDKGASAPRHNHPNEQITYVVRGKLQFWVEDREYLLGPGDLLVIPSYVEHGGKALEDTFTIESFSPIRADWQSFAK
ncbi:MAG: cupin domain-containing protein [Gammaproteobacteria bacterium]